ncbi:3'-5' exonuclease [Pseudidiomarina terrestris]|uniref:3'-5' exonuclease n=1 Tax=Pseudidiomarina terrestris TaxID=2820060 RepID=A0AAW7R1C9_9GAMM|nr:MULTISPECIES: 3'-5' exonuclease [unclassified Pseudidiomarina]MDN7124591.1 3'-5' exonuclease [Pseudidiomarina sp. 1APP75-32.1]MDN7126863.1 3'-5' exonuclease [Pseudidiomarina sp. 1APR75-33.1]MDN7129118.1 3'-5' exonuclease [Pseudidiomarina sp. 1APR75-15]MDN7134618.1 3'-5' exonuclease [Pseudidiomarina sp. 1ASP75-5]
MKALLGKWKAALQNYWQRQRRLRKSWRQQRYVALDLETSGLEPKSDQVLAMGWVVIEPPVLDYQQAQYFVTQAQPDLKQSPVVHGLVRRDFLDATPPQQALEQLATVLNGAVLVCHHVQFDWQFLQRLAKQHQVKLQPLAKFDTLTFEAARLRQQQHHIARGSLTLAACRQRFRLPMYEAHHAYSDAVACGELFLAQAYQYAGSSEASLQELLAKAK